MNVDFTFENPKGFCIQKAQVYGLVFAVVSLAEIRENSPERSLKRLNLS